MSAIYVLIDYENIQPEEEALVSLGDENVKIRVFVNSKQKLSVKQAKTLQPLGGKLEYVEMIGAGKNALDCFISFTLGRLSCLKPKPAQVYVLSKDTGYDPLIKYLNDSQALMVKRVADISKITRLPAKKKEPAESTDKPNERLKIIYADLKKRGDSKPRSLQSLLSTMKAICKNKLKDELSEEQLQAVLETIKSKGHVIVSEENQISYKLP